MILALTDIEQAAGRIAGVVRQTPILTSEKINQLVRREVFFKAESLQITGSFKLRGATNFVLQLTDEEKRAGVVAYSSGNHGKALAYLAHQLNVPVTLVLSNTVAESKLEACRAYGAEIVQYDPETESRVEIADRLVADKGAVLVPPYEHERIVAGQGTAAYEFMQQMSDNPLDTMIIPVGGGGLIAGCALAAKEMNPDIRVYGVEPETGDDVKQSLDKGEIVTIADPVTIVEGLRTNAPGEIPFPYIQKYVDDIYVPSDKTVVEAMRLIWDELKLVVEMAGALSLAALLENQLPADSKRVGVLICGGNISMEDYFEVIKNT